MDLLFEQKKLFCFDLETTGLNTLHAQIVGIALSLAPNKAYYVPLNHTQSEKKQLDKQDVLDLLKPLWVDLEITKLGHNLKYDLEVLLNEGIGVQGALEDTMLASYVCNSTLSRHNMDALVDFYLKVKSITYEEVTGKGAKQIGFAEVPIEQATQYAAQDADYTFRLYRFFQEQLEQAPSLLNVYRDLECPLVPVLVRMERHGVKIDSDLLLAEST